MNDVAIWIVCVLALILLALVVCYAAIPSLRNSFSNKKPKREEVAKEEVALIVQPDLRGRALHFSSVDEALSYLEKKERELGILFEDQEVLFAVEQIMVFDSIQNG